MPLNRQTIFPMELQLLIWGEYMKLQPVVRHEFTIVKDTNETSLWYLSSDARNYRFIDTTMDPNKSVDGLIYNKIDLTDVKFLRPPYHRFYLPDLNVVHLPTQASQASIKVIFERDIFYFNCRRGETTFKDVWDSGNDLSSWGELTLPTNELLQNHDWAVYVQKLALLGPPPEDDFQILTRMTRLKTVYIVVKEATTYPNVSHRFIEVDDFRQISTISVDDAGGQKVRDNLVSLFAKHNMEVEVKVAVDTCKVEIEPARSF
ncbi:hypothetical protein GGR53DRAFT_471186 [Hypoxylon sp. FL1150]|nr:hypothetical protein GGR53DRAFT_471186 [Hypoxylon sp. FL1150]